MYVSGFLSMLFTPSDQELRKNKGSTEYLCTSLGASSRHGSFLSERPSTEITWKLCNHNTGDEDITKRLKAADQLKWPLPSVEDPQQRNVIVNADIISLLTQVLEIWLKNLPYI